MHICHLLSVSVHQPLLWAGPAPGEVLPRERRRALLWAARGAHSSSVRAGWSWQAGCSRPTRLPERHH